MRILVCVKQVPDAAEVRLNEDFTIQREGAAHRMNPADESALELGLSLRGTHGGRVTVLTMGPAQAAGMLRETISRGADSTRRTDALEALMDAETLCAIRREVEAVFVHDAVARYAVRLVDATRRSPYLESGASPRGTLALVRMAKAAAWLQGNGFVAPADIAEQFLPCTNHRVQLSVRARMENVDRETVLKQILEETRRPKLQEKPRA